MWPEAKKPAVALPAGPSEVDRIYRSAALETITKLKEDTQQG
jgi:hypothetical protein